MRFGGESGSDCRRRITIAAVITLPERLREAVPAPRTLLGPVATSAASLAVGVAAIAILESSAIGIADASPVLLLAVVLVGSRYGTVPAVATAILAVLVYDLFFVEPRFTLVIADPREILDLVLFLVVGVAIGRLAAREAERAREAGARAREAETLFTISRLLATADDLRAAAPGIAARLASEARLERVRIVRVVGSRELVLADSGIPARLDRPGWILLRTPGDEPARWVRTHPQRLSGGRDAERGTDRGLDRELDETVLYRVKIEAEGAVLGLVLGARRRADGLPDPGETRLLSLAADQIALAIRREQLAREATDAEIARRSDDLKSALVDSVSHDLRTPLASIRAAAGALLDPAMDWPDADRRAAAATIDAEAERLDRLVRNLLDLGRIEAGALRPHLEVFELADLIEPVLGRARAALGDRPITVELPADLPPVRVDGVLFGEVLANLLENAARYAPPPAPLRIAGRPGTTGRVVELDIEDGGPGVGETNLPRLFRKFERLDQSPVGGRRGMGIGLSVVHGMMVVMNGQASAERSDLGGLRVRLTMDAAPPPASEPAE